MAFTADSTVVPTNMTEVQIRMFILIYHFCNSPTKLCGIYVYVEKLHIVSFRGYHVTFL